MDFLDFFAPSETFEPAGAFSTAHFVFMAISLVAIAISLFFSRKIDHTKVKKLLRFFTILLCALEIAKILFNLITGHSSDLNSYVPLYFCTFAP